MQKMYSKQQRTRTRVQLIGKQLLLRFTYSIQPNFSLNNLVFPILPDTIDTVPWYLADCSAHLRAGSFFRFFLSYSILLR